MNLRKTLAWGLGVGTLMALAACAEARPVIRPDGGYGPYGRPLSTASGGYELQVLSNGVPIPSFFHNGGTYVMGQIGERYTLRIVNHTPRRIEAVVSVDGRDVVDGRSADFRSKRGYLVPAWGSVDIDGWRLSSAQVAAFRFSSVADSYAARTGSSREVGVIGVAIFPERYVPPPRPIYPYRRPMELPYGGRAGDMGPRDKSSGDEGVGAEPPSASRGEGGAAPSPAPSSPSRSLAEAESARRPGLGTEFGEAVGSSVREVSFVRANPGSPSIVLGARYNDRDGLVALGINVDPEPCYAGYGYGGGYACDNDLELRETARPFPVTERRYAAPPPCWNGRYCR